MIYYFLIKKYNRFILFFLLLLMYLFSTYFVNKSQKKGIIMELSPRQQRYLINQGPLETKNIDVTNLKLALDQLNSSGNITNSKRYSSIGNDSPILIIQVHKDLEKLQYLIISLAQVEDIDTSLLIFSHSFYSETMNRLVQSIDYCKVMQIFYPFSLQLNPHKFPGVDPADCINNKNSNSHCFERNAEIAEHKQHWWWKANFVFERMRWTRRHTGPVIFLEENNCVAPDLLLMYQHALMSFNYFPHTEVLSFGRQLTRHIDDLLTVEPWRPPFDIGLAFNKTTWRKMLPLSAHYCMYDDSSWSYSLLNLFKMFPKGHVSMVGCMTPRVLKTEDSFKTCNCMFTGETANPKKVKAVFLYGPDGIVERVHESPPEGAGGWSDLRDQLLCLDPLLSTTTE